MIRYMKRHEAYVRDRLERHPDREVLRGLAGDHDRRIRWMQHERLVHLITMLSVCLFALLAIGYTLSDPEPLRFGLSGLLTLLAVAYLIHYYRLENKIQTWYKLADDMRDPP